MKQDLHTLPENTTFLSSIYRKMCLHYVTMYPRFVFPESVLHSNEVKLAERSKAPDLSSGTRKCAWVRTPHLTGAKILTDLTLMIFMGNVLSTLLPPMRIHTKRLCCVRGFHYNLFSGEILCPHKHHLSVFHACVMCILRMGVYFMTSQEVKD